VDDLLLMSRLEKAGPKREAQLVPLREQVEEALELFAAEAGAHHIRLHLVANPAPLCVLADPAEVQQIITNLVSNAIKYNRPGGSVKVAIDQVDGKVKLAVEDTGVGVAADAIPELGRGYFTTSAKASMCQLIPLVPGYETASKEFHRIKTSDTRNITGTGLGLSIVKRITEKYGGRLSIRSTEGEGSTFAVYLPRVAPEAGASRRIAELPATLPSISQTSVA